MGRKAGVISINLTAGTADFIRDVDRASAKVREFGSHNVSSMQASSAAIRTLEGNFTNNIRAVEKFVGTVLGMGPILQKAFPVVGAIAFAGVVDEVAEKTIEFFKRMADAPKNIDRAFRDPNGSLRLTNDELAVANDRLENSIAKLEGHRENTLRLALDEARVAADKLADSLDKSLAKLSETLNKNKTDISDQLFGRISDKGLRQEIDRFRESIAAITEGGQTKINQAKSPLEATGARAELDAGLQKASADMLAVLDRQISDAKRAQAASGSFTLANYGLLLKQLTDARSAIALTASFVPAQSANEKLTGKKDALTAAGENAAQDRPFADRLKSIAAETEGLQAKLSAIGKPEAAQILAKAYGEAQKAIEEVNKALERHHTSLTAANKAEIAAAEQKKETAAADVEWTTKFTSSTVAIDDRIKAQDLLTAAIGKGYAATKEASVQTNLMQSLGQHFGDADWMKGHAGDVDQLRQKYSDQFEAEHRERTAAAIDGLQKQIELEKALAGVQEQGAEAVRQAALAVKVVQMAREGATEKEILAEKELFNAQRANYSAEAIAGINERIAAIDRLTAAVFRGAEAERQAALENKYTGQRRSNGGTPMPGVIGMSAEELGERTADAKERQQQLTQEALKTGLEYQNQVEHVNDLIGRLEEVKQLHGDSLAIEISMRDLENQRLQALAGWTLQLGTARDGVRAFFLEMEGDATRAGDIIKSSLHSAFDRGTSELAKLATGQKTNFGKAFQEVGGGIAKSGIQALATKGLGKLAAEIGIKTPKGTAAVDGLIKPDGSEKSPFWVRMAGGAAGGKSAGSLADVLFKKSGSDGGDSDDDGSGGGSGFVSGLGGLFKNLFTPRADGGSVDPGDLYMVGERGPEPFIPSTAGTILPAGSLGASNHYHSYSIDARGADLGAANRIRAAMAAVHQSAVATAVQATAERAKRTPQGRS